MVLVYLGGCLIEVMQVFEGCGMMWFFEFVGVFWVDVVEFIVDFEECGYCGVLFMFVFFKLQFQKYGGEICVGVQIVVMYFGVFELLCFGVDFFESLLMQGGVDFVWCVDFYEFILDIFVIDLLVGILMLCECIDQGKLIGDWVELWQVDVDVFDNECQSVLFYD